LTLSGAQVAPEGRGGSGAAPSLLVQPKFALIFVMLAALTVFVMLFLLVAGNLILKMSDAQVNARLGHCGWILLICMSGAGYIPLQTLLEKIGGPGGKPK
jgi:hypothetical protein